MNKKLLLSCILCIICFSYLYALEPIRRDIRVGIILKADSFVAASNEEFYITTADKRKFKLSKGKVELAISGDKLILGTEKISMPVKIETEKGILFANKKPYRGYFSIVRSGNKINVLNILSIEDYIKGVIPKESSPGWHIESLKAQAVISRTYTLANLNKHDKEGFDMCAGTHCQVYGGAEAEAVSSNKAVAETAREVLIYEDKLAQTVFHANCGGRTEDPRYVWDWSSTTPPYLEGVKCGYCDEAPHSSWEIALDESFIRKKLSGYKVGQIKSIKVKGTTPAGSAKDIEVLHERGNLTFNAYKFRLTVDAWKIKSTTFESIKKEGSKFVFKGKGWGHKVGLCQWGAKGMADSGKKYKQILQHYYPKTKIEKANYK